jgi:arylsulfatase A-like enzyme
MRSQITHLIDILPTILAVAGIPAPTPLDGVSIASTFADAKARRVHERQYFEAFTNRAIYDKGWSACAQHTLP